MRMAEFALVACLLVAATLLGRNLVRDFRHGVVHYNAWSYSRAEQPSGFWVFGVLQFVLLAAVLAAAMAALAYLLMGG